MAQQELMDVIDAFTKQETKDPHIQELRSRVNRCKCSYCGSELILRRLTYGNSEEGRLDLFCPSCNRIEYGVEPEIYQIVEYAVVLQKSRAVKSGRVYHRCADGCCIEWSGFTVE